MSVKEILQRLSGKSTIYLTQRGNKSIFFALKIMKALGKKKVVIQDQGGWFTYPQFIEKLKLQKLELPTDFGIINPDTLSKVLDNESVLLINSLTGYCAEQPMGVIASVCKQKGALLINDVSGSIGTELAKYGDMCLGSFGEGKPVNHEYGGFIAFNDSSFNLSLLDDAAFDKTKLPSLEKKLIGLPERLRMFRKRREQVLKDLDNMDIIHRNKKGINVVIKTKDFSEKERVIKYCNKNNYQWVECPRYNKVNVPAVSIEIKRLG